MSKKEIYYKFIFPNDGNLLSDNRFNQVKLLQNANKLNVITYDKLNSTLKSYIDQYLAIPKYFDIRNHRDTDVFQRDGLSLIVSHSPEVNSDAAHAWTKFKSTEDNYTIYCSVVVTSGNFFYNWNLPEEVLAKSNLRDKIVRDRFHSNWYFTPTEQVAYRKNGGFNPQVGQEKRVFIQNYFNDKFNYGHKSSFTYYVNYTDDSGNIYQHDSVFYSDDVVGEIGPSPDRSLDPDNHGRFFIKNGDGTTTTVTRHRYSSATKRSSGTYYVTVGGVQQDVATRRTPETYSDVEEDLKKDYIDLEVTRRVLHPEYDYSKVLGNTPANSIPIIVSGIGKDTVLSYDRPTEYMSHSPMPLRYDLLRDTLNDKDPYGDQETVLVMWVADRDPADSSVKTLTDLQNISFRQYAIPISVRCYFKDTDLPNTNRFQLTYPSNGATTRLHTRRNSIYDKDVFKEALYAPCLAEYSNDYVIAYQNTSLAGASYNGSLIFDVQNYMFRQYNDSFKALYIRKQYAALQYTQHQQNYYMLVNRDKYITNRDLSIRIADADNPSAIFSPKLKIHQEDYLDWNFNIQNAWSINDSWFIALFDKSHVREVTGSLRVVNGGSLRESLSLHTSNSANHYTWDDIYLSSIGLSQMRNWSNADHLLGGIADPSPVVPIGFLDGHIRIDGVLYDSKINGKIVGFKNVFDYTFEDFHHFRYNSTSNEYELVVDSDKPYTVYIVD